MSNWRIITIDGKKHENIEPHKVEGEIKEIERDVNNIAFKIPMRAHLQQPFIKSSAFVSMSPKGGANTKGTTERIVGVHVVPTKDKQYSAVLVKRSPVEYVLGITEVNKTTLKMPIAHKKYPGTWETSKAGFGFTPKSGKVYRVEIHVNPSDNKWHLELKELKETSKDGFP